jgi:SAM-dependent methyltransferase
VQEATFVPRERRRLGGWHASCGSVAQPEGLEDGLKSTCSVVDDPKAYWRAAPHAEGYDHGRFGHLWGRFYRAVEERAIRRAVQALARGGRILDAACGTGRITGLLVREGFAAVVGCDISRAMMSVARRGLGQVEFLQSDATRLPFENDSFDAVTCIGLLMHLDSETRVGVLKELARISRQPLVIQYGCVGVLLRLWAWLTGQKPGGVRYPVVEADMRRDLERSGLRELGRFWVLRPVSSSVILVLAK